MSKAEKSLAEAVAKAEKGRKAAVAKEAALRRKQRELIDRKILKTVRELFVEGDLEGLYEVVERLFFEMHPSQAATGNGGGSGAGASQPDTGQDDHIDGASDNGNPVESGGYHDHFSGDH